MFLKHPHKDCDFQWGKEFPLHQVKFSPILQKHVLHHTQPSQKPNIHAKTRTFLLPFVAGGDEFCPAPCAAEFRHGLMDSGADESTRQFLMENLRPGGNLVCDYP